MKIAVIALSRIPSETANSIQVMKVCQALQQAGHDTTLIVPAISDTPPAWEPLARHYGLSTPFTIQWLPLKNRRLFTLQAVQRARALRPHLLYTWVIQSAVFGLLGRLPTLFEAHEMPSGRVGPWWYRLFTVLPFRKRVGAITRGMQSLLEEKFGRLVAGDFVIAPMGVELQRFPADAGDPQPFRRLTGLPHRPTVMCTGHLYAGRGVELFVDLAQVMPQAHFVWVGGRQQDVSAWRGRAAGVPNLTFTGFIPNADLPLWQAAADVLVMPYGKSIAGSSGGDTAAVASPMKMFEYMAAGRAILSSDLPVIREVLTEDMAVFAPPDDLPAWRAALEDLLAHPQKRYALGRAARAEVEKYTWLARTQALLRGFPKNQP